ncbi:MAG: MoxR family ATPase [Thermoflexaceae bacterium]|nr:MoxR family ATPase [Thermoflexaceae bacterium]
MANIHEIKENIEKVLVGKSEVIDLVLTAMVAGGHVLLEDVPGTGKTVMAKTLAKSVDLKFSRIQFTPDLLPADVTGLNVYNQKSGEFQLKKGPVFGNIVLADEINRATPRTQSSLLECMEEKQVTIDGVTYPLAAPFFVIATENPIETAGTFPLPEAQLDRFLMKLSMGTPSLEEEVAIMNRFLKENPAETIQSVCTEEDILRAGREYKNVFIHKDIISYIANIVEATRKNPNITTGVSPRGSLAMLNAVRSYAYVMGRNYVIPEDVKKLSVPVFAHRISVTAGRHTGSGRNDLIRGIVEQTAVPTEEWDKE